MKPFSYHKATSIEDAITQRAATGARLLAGGTDLIAQMKAGSRTPDVVVDVKGVAELNQIATGGDGELIIGAAVSEIIKRPLGNTDDVLGDKLRAFACTVFGMLQTTLPLDNGPIVKIVGSHLGEDGYEINLPIAQ